MWWPCWAGGVDVVYPRSNRRLFEEVVWHGCLLSEYPPGTQPLAAHFPVRNRIISGLSPRPAGGRGAGEERRADYGLCGPGTGPGWSLRCRAVPASRPAAAISICCGRARFWCGMRWISSRSMRAPIPDLVARCVQAQQELDAPSGTRPARDAAAPRRREPGPEPIPQTVLDAMSPEEQRICALLQARGNMQIDNLVAETGIPAGQAPGCADAAGGQGRRPPSAARYFTLSGAKCK